MNKNTTYIIVGAASMIALISIGSAMSLSSKNKAAKAEIIALQTQIVNMEASLPDVSREPEVIYLTGSGDTNELTALKTQLAEKESQLEDIQSNTNRPARKQRESFEDRIAKMKAEDPEGYAEMVAKREERSSQMRYNLAERTATFMDMDTSMMSGEELENHELLVANMAKIWEMTEQFNDPEASPDREAMREMMEVSRETRPMLEAERVVMFKQLGTELGYEGEDAEAFATHIDEIYEATSIPMSGRGGGGNRGGGGGDRGGGGGGR